MHKRSSDLPQAVWHDLGNLFAAACRLSGLLNLSILAGSAARETRRIIQTDVVCVSVTDDSDDLIVYGVDGQRTNRLPGLRVPKGMGVGGKILLLKRPISIADYYSDLSISHEFNDIMVGEEGIHGSFGFPIISGGKIISVLFVAKRQIGHFSGREQDIVEKMAGLLAQLIVAAMQSDNQLQLVIQEERERIAGELHDTIGSLLFDIGISLRKARELVPSGQECLVSRLREIEAKISCTAALFRESLRALTPSTPNEALPLVIRTHAQRLTARTGIPVHFIVLGELQDLPPAVAATLVAVSREGLQNIEKHARSSSLVVVSLYYSPGEVGLAIQDDGPGLPPGFTLSDLALTGGCSFGLRSVLNSIARLGGNLVLTNNEDGGVLLRVSIPYRDK